MIPPEKETTHLRFPLLFWIFPYCLQSTKSIKGEELTKTFTINKTAVTMADVISLKQVESTQSKASISRREWIVLVTILSKDRKEKVDALDSISLLYQQHFITLQVYTNLLERFKLLFEPAPKVLRQLVMELAFILTFHDIIKFLVRIGCTDLATELRKEANGEYVDVLERADIGVSDEILTYYSRTKHFMDNNIFNDRRTELKKRSDSLLASFDLIKDNEEKKLAVDRYVVITFLRTTQYRDIAIRNQILTEMRDRIPEDVDRTFADVVYYGNMAKSAIFAGDSDLAQGYIQKGLVVSSNCKQTFVRIFLYHDKQHVSRCLFSACPQDSHVKNTATTGQLGQAVLQDLTDEQAEIWRKVFISETIMTLLKVKNTFDILYSEDIDELDRQEAQTLMNVLDKVTTDYEIRREMIRSLCKARINERVDLTLAKTYAFRAMELAKEGSHFPADLNNITKYYEYLLHLTTPKVVV